ncbi:MAG: FAD:protein FMN transferase [Agarilytica sp.]
MGTSVSVTAWHDDQNIVKRAVSAVMQEMHRIDATLSPYKEHSELSRVNRDAAKVPLQVSQELYFLVDKSLYFSRVSEGAFDITFASLGRYYDYRKKEKPDANQHKKLLPAVNYQHIQLNKAEQSLYFSHPHVYIDLGGVAKGYAVDRAAQILRQAGIRHATISAGGDSRVIGDKRGQPWLIGVKNPRQKPGEPDALIRMPLTDVAVSTSGDYERFFIDEENNERVHHILNPKTGKSASRVVSVTVLGAKGVDTDPLSTTVFVLGVEKGLALVNGLPGFDCVIIDSHGKAHYSDGLIEPEQIKSKAQ